ncbi:MAG: hypothetical protein LBT12_01445 [Oscillospiraceae bacterium]|nr:hypothetical protein [Oscillospiraceae bacterium]
MAQTKTIIIPTAFDPAAIVPIPPLDTPITPRENFKRMLDTRNPLYLPNSITDTQAIFPEGFFDGPANPFGDGYDQFGVHWTFVPAVGACTPTPGVYAVGDIERWKTDMQWPDISRTNVDSVRRQAEITPRDKLVGIHIGHGFFERFHHVFGFEAALMAFLTNPDEVHEIFKRLLDLKIQFIDVMKRAGGGIFDYIIHSDDMGTQRSSFFSRAVFEEFIFPYNKTLFDYAHEQGMYVHWHSCGDNSNFLDYMLQLKTDWWEVQSASNDVSAISEKFGGKIAMQLGLDPDMVYKDGVTDEEMKAAARKFVDDAARYKNYAVAAGPMGRQMAEIVIPELRRYSLEAFSR